jgi:6-phosphogluconolactonase (cycloisomerase 2 family)
LIYHVYVSLFGEGRIARYTMDAETGALEPDRDIALSGRPAYAAVDPDRRYMYVARKKSPRITSFAIDPATGDLEEVGTISIAADPAYLATDKTGRFLFSASYFDGITAVHRIGASPMRRSNGGRPVCGRTASNPTRRTAMCSFRTSFTRTRRTPSSSSISTRRPGA